MRQIHIKINHNLGASSAPLHRSPSPFPETVNTFERVSHLQEGALHTSFGRCQPVISEHEQLPSWAAPLVPLNCIGAYLGQGTASTFTGRQFRSYQINVLQINQINIQYTTKCQFVPLGAGGSCGAGGAGSWCCTGDGCCG